jgi:hypothetical protein
MRSYAPWYAAVLVAVIMATPRAQQGQGANISSNDATAVLRRGPLSRVPGEAVTIQSTMPEKFPKDLLPEGSEVLAASVSASLSVVVATVPSKDTFEFTKYQWKLEELGWTNTGGTRFGFTMSGMGGGIPLAVCRSGGEFAQISLVTVPSGARLIRIGVGPEAQRSCAPVGMRTFSDVPLPMLELPASVRSTGGGGGGGTDDTEARARLETAMSSESLATNFIGQMKSGGWRLESGPTTDGVMTVARMSITSRAGDPVTAMVIVTTLSGTPFVDAVIRVVRNKPSR